MGRKRKIVSARKMMRIEECYEDDDPSAAEQSSDNASGGNEKPDENRANIDNQSSEEKSARESFYEKLTKLNEYSGLSLVFNFRDTKLDLYLVYKEVTDRGGSHEVSKAGKWSEVASAVGSVHHASILPRQIQKVYETLLWTYEQINCYRTPGKALCRSTTTAAEGYSYDCSVGKSDPCDGYSVRKSHPCDGSSEDDQGANDKCRVENFHALKGPGRPRKQDSPGKPKKQNSPGKPRKQDPYAPQKARNSYQMFLRMECERLKKIHGENSRNMNLRVMAIEAWRHLSDNDRLPYAEASRKDKERFNRELVIYMQNKNNTVTVTRDLPSSSTPTSINFAASSPRDDDCYVPLELNAGNQPLPNETLVESTIQMLENAKPNDPIFRMNWDG
ncbi:OLC1v1002069C1 [Oldenlandia corymbosa var. corymbosa]|uniref:OLC1v1002069C1 n=1 Tax=Oldenlandia corymbosa var. corymbosa TaxID=529605 RepID=A0AAV1D9K5_OLDCO|nr:OLC1v1002069C1 [Oldenlandia corymbosa var. corymbosa]